MRAVADSLKNVVLIACPGTVAHGMAYNGIFYTTDDVQIAEADTGAELGLVLWLKAAEPGGSGAIIDVSIEASTLLSCVLINVLSMERVEKVPAAARCFSRGSGVLPASCPDDDGGIGLSIMLLSGPVGGSLESALPVEFPLLDGLSRLGAKRGKWQGSTMPEVLKSQEWSRSALIFSAGDSAGKDDATAWVANKAILPYLSALAGEKVTKCGLLIAAGAGFLNCPHAVG